MYNFPTVDVAGCLAELGVKVIRHDGVEIYASCPGHLRRLGKEDTHSSWSVNGETGQHYCFSCGFGGSFVGVVKEVSGLSWNESLAWVDKRAVGGIARAKRLLEQRSKPPEKPAEPPILVNEASLALFVSPPATARSPRLLSAESCRHYGVLWDAERQMWILPVRQLEDGKILGWQEKNERYFGNYPRHIPMSKTLFGYQQFPVGVPAIIVESPLDVVRLHTVGIEGGLSTFGAHVNDTQLDAVKSVTDEIIVAMDNDAAGARAAQDIKRRLAGRMTVRFINYEGIDVKDVGEMSAQEIRRSLDSAYSSVLARF